jgi:parallel beta-helix repeat protein
MLPIKPLGALGAGLIALGIAAPAHAATFAVNNTNSSGAGSLRSAINAANGTAARDSITFAIPGAGPQVITLANDLPVITQPVDIKGYTQPGSTPPSATSVAVPQVVINATNALRGLDIASDGSSVRGLVIRNAQVDGMFIEGDDNVIAGNLIGTDAAGNSARPNLYGVHVDGGQDNEIGGPDAEDRNVISSNLSAEVYLDSGDGNSVQGNRLGTDGAGAAGIGGFFGVLVESDGNTVEDNLVSDEYAGISLRGADNTAEGNTVGTNLAATSALPNTIGIGVGGGDSNHVDDNLIAGNSLVGLQFISLADAATGNDADGNTIGLDAAGAALPNGTGVLISGSNENVLTGNTIAANLSDGVQISSDGADDNRLEGNTIGLDGLGNGGSGVKIDGGEQNHVGDPGNTIAHNGVDGVTVVDGIGNAIRKNSIHDNGALGIDLGANGPTANDTDDPDTGPNQLQNDPEIEDADATTVDWELDSVPLTDYRLDFFASDSCDPSGSGEGQTFLDSITVSTNANGDVDGSTVTAIPPGAGKQVTMTATKLVGAGTSRSTSEFSPCEAT